MWKRMLSYFIIGASTFVIVNTGESKEPDEACIDDPAESTCKIKNEEYFECVPTCPPEGCDTSNAMYKCSPFPEPGSPECQPGCRCKLRTHFRNKAGECVPKEECEINNQCKPNETFSECPIYCSEGCNVDPRVIKCARPIPGSPGCNPEGCVCNLGYCRDDKGNCVIRKKKYPFPR